MNKTELENIISYNNHAVTMAQIAVNLLEGKNPLNVAALESYLRYIYWFHILLING